MRKLFVFVLVFLLLLCCGCTSNEQTFDIVATTLPVFNFTDALCEGTPLTVGRLVTENVSCLHDYTLQVGQMQMIEHADVVVISGAGLEDFLQDILHSTPCVIDSSPGAHIHSTHVHEEEPSEEHGHHHEQDPHLWLSPNNAAIMAQNICKGLSDVYPEYTDTFQENLTVLTAKLDDLQTYAETTLSQLSCREMITFHDGFAYFAETFDLTILKAIEEESGSEPSAKEIISLIDLVNDHNLPAVFTEVSGSDACAGIISRETGAKIYALDMAMTGDSYFDSMYHNIDTVKEALG